MKTLLLCIGFLLSFSLAFTQPRPRDPQPYKQDTLKLSTFDNNPETVKKDSSSFKLPIDVVNYDAEKMERLFNPEMSERDRIKHKKAITFFTEQIAADTSNVGAYVNRGTYMAELGLHVEAIKDYNKAIALDPTQSISYYNRAISKARFMYTLDACKDLKKAKELGLEMAGPLMDTKCGRYVAQLKDNPQNTSSSK